jgi:hypothetical protein
VLADGFITASDDKANPAQSADQSIVAEVCPGRKRLWRAPLRRRASAAEAVAFLKIKREKFVNELKRFAARPPHTDTHLLQTRVYFCQRNFLLTLSHFCKKADDSAYSLS